MASGSIGEGRNESLQVAEDADDEIMQAEWARSDKPEQSRSALEIAGQLLIMLSVLCVLHSCCSGVANHSKRVAPKQVEAGKTEEVVETTPDCRRAGFGCA